MADQIYANVYDYDPSRFGEQRLDKNLPSVWCRRIAKEVGLMEVEEKGKLFLRQLQTMAEFQQLSIVCDLATCIDTIFYGANLNESQLEGLTIIHRTTKPWIKGHLVGIMLEKIDSNYTSNKDFANSFVAILEALNESDTTEKEVKKTSVGKRLLLKLTTQPIDNNTVN